MKYRGSYGIYTNNKIHLKVDDNQESFDDLEEGEEVIVLSAKQFYQWIKILKEEIDDIEGFDLEMINFFMKY
jgi:hypothetical protein